MARWFVASALVAAACGGPPPPAAPVGDPEPPRARRVPIEEPDEEPDGVQIVSSRGRMEPAAVEAGLRPHHQALSECYTTRVGRRRWLGGHVVFRWDIKRSGEIAAVKLIESDLGAWPVEKCLLDVARAAQFAKPIGGDADFQIPLDFSAKGRSEPWDEDQGLRAVGGQLGKLAECDAAKGVTLPPPRDVTITVYVGPRGKAQSVGFASATSVIDDVWADCAEKAALGWRLPDPKGTVAKLAVRYRAN